jgi:hypothetical protein
VDRTAAGGVGERACVDSLNLIAALARTFSDNLAKPEIQRERRRFSSLTDKEVTGQKSVRRAFNDPRKTIDLSARIVVP